MFKSTKRFLSNTADYLYEEIEDRLVEMLGRDKSSVENESTHKLKDQQQATIHID